MESGGEIGHQAFCSSGVGKGNLHCVEVPNDPRHGEVHRSELAKESLQIFNGYAPLAIGYLHKGYDLEALLGRQGKSKPVGDNRLSQDLLDCCPLPFLVQRLLQSGGVLHLTRQ